MKATTLFTSIALFSAAFASLTVFAAQDELPQLGLLKKPEHVRYVENSYIVAFRVPFVKPPNPEMRGKVAFGQRTNGQSKQELARELNLKGEVVAILETLNAVHVKTSHSEALRLSRDKRVRYVEQGIWASTMLQNNPGWGLDRMDEATPTLDNTFNDVPANGAGSTIYILDTGIALNNPAVAAEFGGRASVIWDVNGDVGNDGYWNDGQDCNGHGTMVSSAAAGNIHGVAKGANLLIAKVTEGCTQDVNPDTLADAFDWLATYAPHGSIVNLSLGFSVFGDPPCPIGMPGKTHLALEESITNASNSGVIIVVAAGNDGCNTRDYTPTRLGDEVFVVGATSQDLITTDPDTSKDALGYVHGEFQSRIGVEISAFAPGEAISVMDMNGNTVIVNGTSFSSPYIAGIFATACQLPHVGNFCQTASTAEIYDSLREEAGVLGTVVESDGTVLEGATSRFIPKVW